MKRAEFAAAFAIALETLMGAEKITRETLRDMSRNLLIALHGNEDATLYGDIQFVNQVIPVLTPVNKKVFIAFMKAYTGFHFDENQGIFTKKSKKRGVAAQEECRAALENPHFNIWSWAERNIEVQVRPFTDEKVTKFVEGAIKKMAGDQARVLRAVIAAGITPEALMVVLDEMTSDKSVEAVEAAPI